MNRPLSDKRPVGPIFKSSGECKLRAKFLYTTKQGVVESIPSLKNQLSEEIEMVVSFSNLRVHPGEYGQIEVSFDVDSGKFGNEDEKKIERGIGRSLMDGGAENVRAESYTYTVVSR